MSARALTLAAGVALLLSACGGGGSDLTGKATIPEGYETFRGEGVSFAYPRGWDVERTRDADGAPSIQFTPPDKSATPYGTILLTVEPGAGERFESLADQRRVVIETVNDGEIESDSEVELDGAEQALRVETTTPPGQGNDPVEVRSNSLDVLRENGDVLTFVAAAPQREGSDLDPEAVVSSFRLTGS